MIEKYRVKTSELSRQCADDPFDFTTTKDLEPLDEVIGQRRAVDAIHFGLNMKGPGYHIFITGFEGTGRTSITKDILTGVAKTRETPEDVCLVNNFDDPYRPGIMRLPTGSAVFFAGKMSRFIETLKVNLPRVFEEKPFLEKQKRIKESVDEVQDRIMSEVAAEAEKKDITIVTGADGFQAVPLKDGEPVSEEAFDKLDPAVRAAMEKELARVQQEMKQAVTRIQKQTREMQEGYQQLVTETAGNLFSEEMESLFADFKEWAQAQKFLEAAKKDLINHLPLLLQSLDPDAEQEPKPVDMAKFLEKRYQVNVLVDRRGQQGVPVIFEPVPSFQNLFGKIEKTAVQGMTAADFTMVQAGSLLRADKGFLMLEIDAVLRHPELWETLKTTLQNKKLHIQDPPNQTGPAMASLRPDPIDLDVKVVLVGGYEIFRVLQGADPKFNKIFKVRADFDHEVGVSPKTLHDYARYVARACQTEKLRPFTPCGVTEVVGYGNRLAENQHKLSLRFGRIMDLLKEADFWAGKEQAPAVTGDHVIQALTAFRFRHNLHEEKVQERYDDHSILIDLTGSVVGQVNALAVYQIGELAFGRPTRITAESYMGKPGIINVEREADLSGETHDKGMMIIDGFLGRMFAQEYPLSVSVSITFEQSYSGVDGDSASSTELYAVLSSLSGYPIRQGIAVTGSVNQKGQIQSIGGVNEKIEGFFDVCTGRGLTGDQGVMIPAANVNNLMLRKDVVEAVAQGRFHIWQVAAIEQGIEVLTGVPAGQADADFQFPPDTVFGAVQAKLKKFHDRSVLKTVRS
ncbi:MAG: Lon protease family protein [Thermodesulfobacteriota bacterium]